MEKLWNANYIKVWISNFLLFFSFMLLAPLLPLYLNETYQADKDVIGLVLSGYTLAALLIRPFSGFIVDNFPRKTVLLVCYFLFSALFSSYLLAGSLTVFAIFRTLHGAPFGAATVANSTVAIDVLHPDRRAEGIGYYGLSNNIAMAIGPSIALYIYHACNSYNALFILSLVTSLLGLLVDSTIRLPHRAPVTNKKVLSLDRFLMLKGWSQGTCMICFAFSYGILATYLAIYGKQELGIITGTGTYFMLLAFGLILSRLVGTRTLRQGKILHNAILGSTISFFGYLCFAAFHNLFGYYASAIIIGLGNGHLWPAFQSMFLNMAPHSQRGTANSTLLTSWDLGIGIGVLIGGFISETFGYHSAFWVAWIVNGIGIIFLYTVAARLFIKYRLR